MPVLNMMMPPVSSNRDNTYEATRARQSTRAQPDKIHWEAPLAFRNQPYRYLHHQRGLIGKFDCRLLEARDLKRSHWSALALGPVKHLGLSKAHGAVSSYCTISLQFIEAQPQTPMYAATPTSNNNNIKPAAKLQLVTKSENVFVSPVVPQNNNPVWEHCTWSFDLHKGSMPVDGMRIIMKVCVEEDRTAMESLLPSAQGRLLGVGQLDVTDLCLGESTTTSVTLPGVVDAWIDLSLPAAADTKSSGDASPQSPAFASTGQIRLLVSYHPHGIDPQPKDVVALEAFARRPIHSNACRPMLPPLSPMIVLERRGAYLLVEYTIDVSSSNSSSSVGRYSRVSTSSSSSIVSSVNGRKSNKACMRLHRHAVFVIERTTWVDAAHHLLLLPADVWTSTPIGQASIEMTRPLVAAAQELCMPAMLSGKLIWMALRTASLAGWSGVQALTSTLWSEGTHSLTQRAQREPYDHQRNNNNKNNNRLQNSSHVDNIDNDRASATAQFVQL